MRLTPLVLAATAAVILVAIAVPANSVKVVPLHVVKTQGAVWGTPLFSGGKLFVASYDRSVTAVDALSGTVVWKKSAENSIRGNLALDSVTGAIIDVTLSGTITMRDALTGETIWKHQRKSFTWTFSPIAVGDYVFVPMRNDDLAVLSLRRGGVQVASLASSSGVWSTPLVVPTENNRELQVVLDVTADASVVSSTFSSHVDANVTSFRSPSWKFDAVPGATHYKQKMHAWIFGSPCLCRWGDRSAIVFGGNDRVLRAVAQSTGKEIWSAKVGGKVSSTTAVVTSVDGSGGVMDYPVVTTERGDIICIGATGQVRWQSSLRQPIASMVGPTVVANIVVVGGMRGHILGLDGITGVTLFEYDLPQCSVRSNAGMYVTDTNTVIVAVGCDNGAVHVVQLVNVKVSGVSGKSDASQRSVLRDINRAVSQPFLPSDNFHAGNDGGAPPPTSTPILILAFLSVLSGAVLFARRNHLRKAKS